MGRHRTIARILFGNLLYALFTAGAVYFGGLQQVLAGEYGFTTGTITLIWFVNGLAVIVLDVLDLKTLLEK